LNTAAFDVEECLEGVRRQDAAAAHALVEHLYPLVIRIVRAHLPRRLAEEDLAQEVFLKVHPVEACAGRWKVVKPESTGSSSLIPSSYRKTLHDPRRTVVSERSETPEQRRGTRTPFVA
jgi:hypothetical protein